MNIIWRLGIMKEQEQKSIITKNKAELLKNDLEEICRSLVERFPAMGRESSFSLRMSSTLVYGASVNLRIQAEDLLKATRRLLSIKPASFNQGIDLAVVAPSNQLTKAGEPCPADFQLGLMDLDNPDVMSELSPIRVLAAHHEITMVEPVMTGLEFEGQPLPVLTEEELLGQPWVLDAEPEPKQQQDEDCNGKRAREGADSEDTAAKKLRLESEASVIEAFGDDPKTRPETEVRVTEETVIAVGSEAEQNDARLDAPSRRNGDLDVPTV